MADRVTWTAGLFGTTATREFVMTKTESVMGLTRAVAEVHRGDDARLGMKYKLSDGLSKEPRGWELAAVCGLNGIDTGDAILYGTVSMSGEVRLARGVFPVAEMARDLRLTLIVSVEDEVVARSTGATVKAIRKIEDLLLLSNAEDVDAFVPMVDDRERATLDFSDIRGQVKIKRAIEIAASGRFSILLVGAPGSGKTMAARRAVGLLPTMTDEESNDVRRIYSIAGMLGAEQHRRPGRPFRAPHHTISKTGMLGLMSRPGELTLATHGALFLDEVPEFSAVIAESVGVALANGFTMGRTMRESMPARPWLIGATNPCPCGWRGMAGARECECSDASVARYLKRVSMWPFDLMVKVEREPAEVLSEPTLGATTEGMASRVHAAIVRSKFSNVAGESILVRVARVIADLDGRNSISRVDMDEANNLVFHG